MKLKELALEIAQGEIAAGAREIGENNAGPFVEKYLHGLAEPPANACAAFVSWCYLQASGCFALNAQYIGSGKMPFEYSLSARAIYNEFKRKHQLIDIPVPGDLIFFWRGSINSWTGHAGIVYDLNIDRNDIFTIEFNKGPFPAKVDFYKYKFDAIPQLLGFGSV